MSGMYSFDPAKIAVIIGGVEIQGFSDGTFVRIDAGGVDWETVMGADGDVVRVKKQNRLHTLTLTLLQTSPSNDVLSAWRVLDKATLEGAVAAVVRDLNGSTVISADYAYITEVPTGAFGDGIEKRVWGITLYDASLAESGFYIGGSRENKPVGGEVRNDQTFADIPTISQVADLIEAGGGLKLRLNQQNVNQVVSMLDNFGASLGL
jgi:hypothetical protein